VTTMTTASGQTLTTETVLPVGAQISVSPLVDEVSSPPANLEPMRYRLQVSAPEGMGTARFLHVLQGGDAGTTPQAVGGIDSAGVQGVMVGTMAVVFPVELGAGVGGLFVLRQRARTHPHGVNAGGGLHGQFCA